MVWEGPWAVQGKESENRVCFLKSAAQSLKMKNTDMEGYGKKKHKKRSLLVCLFCFVSYYQI